MTDNNLQLWAGIAAVTVGGMFTLLCIVYCIMAAAHTNSSRRHNWGWRGTWALGFGIGAVLLIVVGLWLMFHQEAPPGAPEPETHKSTWAGGGND